MFGQYPWEACSFLEGETGRGVDLEERGAGRNGSSGKRGNYTEDVL